MDKDEIERIARYLECKPTEILSAVKQLGKKLGETTDDCNNLAIARFELESELRRTKAALDAAQAAQKERELRLVDWVADLGDSGLLSSADTPESLLATFDAQEKARKEQGNG